MSYLIIAPHLRKSSLLRGRKNSAPFLNPSPAGIPPNCAPLANFAKMYRTGSGAAWFSARGLGPRGREFKSRLPDQNDLAVPAPKGPNGGGINYRRVRPVHRLIGHVVSCSEVAPGTFLLWLESALIAAGSRPGQFVTIACGDRTLLRRPFSIHDADSDRIAILFSSVGRGTTWLSHRRSGDPLDILGPLGNGFTLHPHSRNLLLVAGGIGVAPLVFLARKALTQGLSVKMILGVSTASCLFPLPTEVEPTIVTEDGSAGRKGRATDLLPEFVSWADEIVACGPIPMYRSMAGMRVENKPVHILLEQVMGCGVGACRGCSIPTKHGMRTVCREGPVFELGEILWEGVPEPTGCGLTE